MHYVHNKVFCSNCNKDVSILHIKCAECDHLNLCLQCFSLGVELQSHLKTHKYVIIDNGTFSLFDSNWTAEEEHLLIDSVEQYGLGNWDEVAANLPDKSATEVEEHYLVAYVDGKLGSFTLPAEVPNKITDHTPPIHDSTIATYLQTEVSKQQQQELAFMPNRDDYEFEYDNEAESIVSLLCMNPDDGDLDRKLKLATVSMYHARLMERQRRKDIVREYKLINKFFRKDHRSMYHSKYEKEIRLKLRSCSQFMKSEQFDKLLKGLVKERQLKRKIAKLKHYRKNGLVKFDSCNSFEASQHQRDKKFKNDFISAGNNVDQTIPSDSEQCSIDIKSHPSYYLLGNGEKHFCLNVNMSPSSYITAKVLVLKDSLLKQHFGQTKTRYSVCIEKSQRRRILSYLKDNGWLS